MFPGCCWVGLAFSVAPLETVSVHLGGTEKFATIEQVLHQIKEKLWKSESKAPVGETLSDWPFICLLCSGQVIY